MHRGTKYAVLAYMHCSWCAGPLQRACGAAAAARFPATARWLRPREGTNCDLPHPIMVGMSVLFVLRLRFFDA